MTHKCHRDTRNNKCITLWFLSR